MQEVGKKSMIAPTQPEPAVIQFTIKAEECTTIYYNGSFFFLALDILFRLSNFDLEG